MGLVTRLWLSILSELLYVITDMTVVTVWMENAIVHKRKPRRLSNVVRTQIGTLRTPLLHRWCQDIHTCDERWRYHLSDFPDVQTKAELLRKDAQWRQTELIMEESLIVGDRLREWIRCSDGRRMFWFLLQAYSLSFITMSLKIGWSLRNAVGGRCSFLRKRIVIIHNCAARNKLMLGADS